MYVHSVHSGYGIGEARNGELCNLPAERVRSYVIDGEWRGGSELYECHESGMVNFGPLALGTHYSGTPGQTRMMGWILSGPNAEWVRMQPMPGAEGRLASSVSGLGHLAVVSAYGYEPGLTLYRATPDTTGWAGPVMIDANADCEETAVAPGFLVCWPDRANVRIYDLLNWVSALDTPTPLEPADGEPVTDIPRLVWSSVPGARSYTVEYTVQPDFWSTGANRVEGVTDTSLVLPLTPNIYRWRVWAEAENTGSAWTLPRTFRVGVLPPTAPVLQQPATGETLPPGPVTLAWSAGVQATLYRVQVSRSATFVGLTAERAVGGLSTVVDSLPSGPDLFWRVRGENGAGNSPWSAARTFRVAYPPSAAPALLAPPNGELGIATDARFLWTPTSPVGTHEIEFAHTPLFESAARRHDVGDSTYVPEPPLERNRLYFWRVRGTTVDGPGVWSLVHSFTTSSVVAGEAAPETFSAGAPRPNPARATSRVDLSVPAAGRVRVEVLDALGRVVAVPLDGDLTAGQHPVPIATDSLPAGVYVVRVSAWVSDRDVYIVHHRMAVVR